MSARPVSATSALSLGVGSEGLFEGQSPVMVVIEEIDVMGKHYVVILRQRTVAGECYD